MRETSLFECTSGKGPSQGTVPCPTLLKLNLKKYLSTGVLVFSLFALLVFFLSCSVPVKTGRKWQGDGAEGVDTVQNGSERTGSADDDDDDTPPPVLDGSSFTRQWSYAGETSAVVYWQLKDIDKSATSYVEFGESTEYGQKTEQTAEPRWGHFHRITGLSVGKTYHYRMILVNEDGSISSDDLSFSTAPLAGAIKVPGQLSGPPYQLSESGKTYILTQDITAAGSAIEITGTNTVFDLDGHTITFGNIGTAQNFGVNIKAAGPVTVRNGHIVQGGGTGDYSSAVESRYITNPREVFGISTHVKGPNAYPIRFFGSAKDVNAHHNNFYSTVTVLESRHWPGNDLMFLKVDGGNISVSDNLFTEGTHRGINMTGVGPNVEISYNDIKHHARYVNGYALACGVAGADIHHNKVTSTGRAVHLLEANLKFHDNYLDTQGHMTLSDMPQGTKPFKERMVELHGIKFEGDEVINAKVYNNFMRITQHLPDGTWEYVPATPLNIAGYNRNAMNEVYDNTFICLETKNNDVES